ncbi:MAG: ATP-binding protein [Halofilum sp. (in: g-proteobacteria)]
MTGNTGRSLRDLVARLLPGDGDDVDLTEAASDGDRRLAPGALHALGLSRQPFPEQTLPAALFVDQAVEMQVNALADQLRSGEMVPLLKGEPGSGKTSLLIHLMTHYARDYHFFVVRGESSLTARRTIVDMLRVLVRPVPEDLSECFRELARQLRSLIADGCPAVLVIDDADALDDDELNDLLSAHDSLKSALGGRFRILLAASSRFELRVDNLQSRQLDAGRIVATAVRPMQRQRVGPYLQQRLKAAGLEGEWSFDEEDIDRIAEAGDGLPRALEAAAASLLNQRFGD